MKKPAKSWLLLGDYGSHTGYGTVLANLVAQWKKIYGNTEQQPGILQTIVACNNFGKRDEDGKLHTFWAEDKWTEVVSAIFSTPVVSTPESKDDFGRHGFLKILKHSNDPEDETEQKLDYPIRKGFDGIFILQDAGVINPYVPLIRSIKSEFKEKNQKSFKSIFYFPCDNEMLPSIIDKLDFFDLLITYNEWSRQALLKKRPELKPKLKVIPHGIDLDIFNIKIAADFRKEYFGEHAGKFIVTNVNRNQPRKDIPCTIFGFAEFKKTHPDSVLYLHMNPHDPAGWDLPTVLAQTDLLEGVDVLFPPLEKQNHGASAEELAMIYSASDVYLTTTLGEGWGLGVTEAMACGLPVICPNHTSFIEIGDHGKRVYALENLYPICTADNIIREQCDYLEVAEKLALVHRHMQENHEVYYQKIMESLEYTGNLSWQRIAGIFADYMDKL